MDITVSHKLETTIDTGTYTYLLKSALCTVILWCGTYLMIEGEEGGVLLEHGHTVAAGLRVQLLV